MTTPWYIDTHFHLTEPEFLADARNLLASLAAYRVKTVIVPTYHRESIEKALRLKSRFPQLPVAVGIHPKFAAEGASMVGDLAADCGCIAIGEIGLDGTAGSPPINVQLDVLHRQLAIAKTMRVPVILHCVRRHAELLEALAQYPGIPGVLHRASCGWEEAKRYLKAGIFLGFGPEILFASRKKMRILARKAPQNHIVLETDAPFTRGPVYPRSKPSDIPVISTGLSALRKDDPVQLAERIFENTCKLFRFSRDMKPLSAGVPADA